MKKLFSIMLLLTAMLCACDGTTKQGAPSDTKPTAEMVTLTPVESQNQTESEAPAGNVTSDGDVTEEVKLGGSNTISEERKNLVVYFSCTGNTKEIAETLSAAIDADLYEITPAQPYTTDDLNYNDSSTRATREQNDSSARPTIAASVENMQDYDVIYLGYPIWWGIPPRIIQTFLESYDLSEKAIVPFCTSGGSGYNDSNLAAAAPGAVIIKGQRFRSGISQEDMIAWVNSLNLNG